MHAFDAGRVAPEAVDGRGVDLAVQARQLVDERVVPVVRFVPQRARPARAPSKSDKNGFYSDAVAAPLPPKETSRIRASPRSPRP